MGIKNLFKIIKNYSPNSINSININELSYTNVAIDANLFIYKSIYAIRKTLGKDITKKVNNKIKNVTHIHVLFMRLYGLKINNIKAIFVFDNLYSDLKKETMNARKDDKNKIKKKYEESKTEEEKKKYFYAKENITNEEYDDIIKLIELFGFRYIISNQESDSECAFLNKKGIVKYVISDDADMLLFGTKFLIKNFSTDKKKLMEIYDLKQILKDFKFNQKKLIELGILLGTDYTEKIKGIGEKRAFDLINTHNDIKNMIKKNIISKNFKYEDAFKYFKNPKHNKLDLKKYKNKKVNIKELKLFMKNNGFIDNKTIDNYLDNLEKLLSKNK